MPRERMYDYLADVDLASSGWTRDIPLRLDTNYPFLVRSLSFYETSGGEGFIPNAGGRYSTVRLKRNDGSYIESGFGPSEETLFDSGPHQNYQALYPAEIYPEHSTITVDVFSASAVASTITILLRGSLLVSDASMPAYRYPAKFTEVPFQWVSSTEITAEQTIRDLQFPLQFDADVVVRRISCSDIEAGAYVPVSRLFYQLRDSNGWPYSNTEIRSLWFAAQSNPQWGRTVTPEICLRRGDTLYYNVRRDDAGADPALVSLVLHGAKIQEIC